MVVLLGGLNLVDGRPTNVANLRRLDVLLPEELLGLMRLHPNLVDALRIRKPGLVGPLGIGNPDVLRRIGEETGVDDLNEEVNLCLRTLRVEVGDVSNLGILPKHMGDKTMKNRHILRDTCPLAMIADDVDSHFL